MLALANRNPAFTAFGELFDETPLAARSDYRWLVDGLHAYFETRPRYGPENQNLVDLLERRRARAPRISSGSSRSSAIAGTACWGPAPTPAGGDRRPARGAIAVWMRFQPRARGRRTARPSGLEHPSRSALRPARPRRGGALQPRSRLDAPHGHDRQERVRLARPALPSAGPSHPPPGSDPGRGAGSTGRSRLQRVVDDRRVGAQPRARERIKQIARQSRGGGLSLFAAGLPSWPPSWWRGGVRYRSASAPRRAASGWRATWCRITWASTRAG